MKNAVRPRAPRLILPLLAVTGLLSGCNLPTTSSISGPTLTPFVNPTGFVHGGLTFQPMIGATIQLYEVGQSGFTGSPAKPLLPTSGSGVIKTGTDGSFTITGDYTCDAGAYLYLTASGGNPGGANSVPNPQSALMATLGACAKLVPNSITQIDESTTVAAVYSLAQFAKSTTFGTPLSAQPGSVSPSVAPADNFSTSSTNIQGVANAMAISQVLSVNSVGDGPGNNTQGRALPDYWQLNTIADILSACVGTTGGASGDGSACGTLFANVPHANGVPADTIQATLALALNPTLPTAATNALYNLIPITPSTAALLSPPYLPFADQGSIVDWSIGITYTPYIPGTTYLAMWVPQNLAIDSAGNVWITVAGNTGQKANDPIGALPSVVELDPTGNVVQAGQGTGVYSISNYLAGSTVTPIVGNNYNANTPFGMAIDTADNVWVADEQGNAIFKITGSGGIAGGPNGGNATGPVPAIGYNIQTAGGMAASLPLAVAIDGQNNVWWTQGGGTGPGGTCGTYTAGNKGIGGFLAGNYGKYFQGGVQNFTPYGIAIDSGTGDSTTSGSTSTPIPGAPFLWVVNQQAGNKGTTPTDWYGAVSQYYATGNQIGCPTPLGLIGAGQTTKILPTPTAGGGLLNMSTQPQGIAFDHSGNMWLTNMNYVDTLSTVKSSVSKVSMKYGTAFTAAQAAANTTFQNFQVGAGTGATNTYAPQYLAVDGDGDVWVTGTLGGGIVELDNNGNTLSPATGFIGSTYTVVTNPNATPPTTSVSRRLVVGSRGMAIDRSGNVWIANTGGTTVTTVVGAAAPVTTPLSLAVKNNALGILP